ncbi:MAG: alanyl-tRNA editing protein [Betaproteobacteria bacterium]|nr:alanyl-tRNA editing protein [Betaproteobacteria bacterium]MBV9360799.1 alanyl-tRNA editing protein [Betaproteobacteria bacterium]
MAQLLFREDPYLKGCEATVVAVHGDAVELDRTVFYPLGGGQAGDTGKIGDWRVIDTRKGPLPDQVLHVLEPGSNPAAGGKVEVQLDWERRHRLMRLHTALHLLGSVVKASVTGGRINDDKAHLDFDIEMERLVKDAIEAQVNELVKTGTATRAQWITDAELDARPELVRTMSVAPPRGEGPVRLLEIPGIDLQACGGTHVANTAEIGLLKVMRIRSEGKRNKRVTLELA